MLQNYLDAWMDWLLPAHCLLCGLYSGGLYGGAGRLCAACSEELPVRAWPVAAVPCHAVLRNCCSVASAWRIHRPGTRRLPRFSMTIR